MKHEDILWRLAQLSSLPFQERYVIGGTPDEYVLDTELLENVDSIKYLVRRPEQQVDFTDLQIRALEQLFEYVELHSGEALSGASGVEAAALIRESSVWHEMRAKAASALEAFGLSPAMTVEEIDRISA